MTEDDQGDSSIPLRFKELLVMVLAMVVVAGMLVWRDVEIKKIDAAKEIEHDKERPLKIWEKTQEKTRDD